MTWQLTITRSADRGARRADRDGRRVAADADVDPLLRLPADARGRHRLPPRRRFQVFRRSASPKARDRAREDHLMDDPRLGADVAARRRGRELDREPLRERRRRRDGEGDRHGSDPRRPRLPRQDVRQARRPALGRAVPARQPRPRDLPRARRERRVHRRPDVGRQRHLFRARDAPGVPADRGQDRRDGHLSRGRAALGRGDRPPRARERRSRRDGLAPARLDPGHPVREQADRARPGRPLRVGLGTVLLASGVRLVEFPGYGCSCRSSSFLARSRPGSRSSGG